MLFFSNCFIGQLQKVKSPFIREKVAFAFNKYIKSNNINQKSDVNFLYNNIYPLIKLNEQLYDGILWITQAEEMKIVLNTTLDVCLKKKIKK
jgi:hypothetical protein